MRRPAHLTDSQPPAGAEWQMVAHAAVGLMLVRQGQLQHANDRLAALFGHTDGSAMRGLSLDQLFPPDLLPDALRLEAQQRLLSPPLEARRWQARRRDGSCFWSSVRGQAVQPGEAATDQVWVIDDIEAQVLDEARKAASRDAMAQAYELQTQALRRSVEVLECEVAQRQQAQERVEYLALHDPLTNLPSRGFAETLLDTAIAQARDHHQQVVVIYINLDRFKAVNDANGRDVGDRVLRAVGKRLLDSVKLGDIVARMGADEFVVVMPGIGDRGIVAQRAREIRAVLAQPMDLGPRQSVISCRMGVSLFPSDGDTPQVLIKNAELAMNQADAHSAVRQHFFNAELDRELMARLAIEEALPLALRNGQMSVVYQPQFDIASGALVGVEALARWQHPALGDIGPTVFIPIAEETGWIDELGLWILERALTQARAWQRAGLPRVTMAVNASARQIASPGFCDKVLRALTAADLAPAWLEVEITESVMMQNVALTASVLERLRRHGVGVSIDDFGTGYSSLAYLNQFSLTKLKIDQSFVKHIHVHSSDAIICRAIIAMAAELKLKVTAEGVETEHQLALLRRFGCDIAQGALFGKPVAAEAIEALLRQPPRSLP